ncbi:MAG: isoprenylcysteine carboxylmethyltransferase family protein [Candidatus Omnitrophota bacterium]
MLIMKVIMLLGVPFLTLFLYFNNPSISGRTVFSLFILFVIFERVWEGLYTSKDKDMNNIEGDWTLPASMLSYIFLVIFCLAEFYKVDRQYNNYLTSIGICMYIAALYLRLWAVNSLGDQWSVHIIGKEKLVGHRKLVTKGPYKYIRHPVYIGIVLEQIGIPLIFNLFYTAIIIGFFSITLQLIKSGLEEKEMKSRLGKTYEDYLKNTARFNPFFKFIAVRRKGGL